MEVAAVLPQGRRRGCLAWRDRAGIGMKRYPLGVRPRDRPRDHRPRQGAVTAVPGHWQGDLPMRTPAARALRAAAAAALVLLGLAGAGNAGAASPAAGGAAAMAASRGSGAARAPPETAYVLLANAMIPIRTATNTAGEAINVGCSPANMAITPNGKAVYVTNYASCGSGMGSGDTVTPVRTATNTPGTAITVGIYPYAIAVTPDGKTAYVTNTGSDTVTPIRTATNKPGKAITG